MLQGIVIGARWICVLGIFGCSLVLNSVAYVVCNSVLCSILYRLTPVLLEISREAGECSGMVLQREYPL